MITYLRLKNFLNVSEAELHFKPSITVISGPNGAGKSTIFNAIALCLLDAKRGDTWKESIKNGEKSFEIELKMEIPAEIRFLYSGTASGGSMSKEIWYKGNYYKNAQCNELLSELFDLSVLENVVFNFQDSPDISSLTPAQLRDMLKKIFSVDFGEHILKLKKDVQTTQEELKLAEGALEVLKNKTYPEIIIFPTKTEEEIEQLRREVSKLENEKTTIEAYIQSHAKKIQDAQKTKLELQYNIQRTTNQIDMYSKKKQEAETVMRTIATENAQYQQESIEIKENTIPLIEEELKRIQTIFEDEQKSYEDLQKQLEQLRREEAQAWVQVTNTKQRLQKLDGNYNCPICGQPCDESVIGLIKKELTGAQEKAEKASADTLIKVKEVDQFKEILSSRKKDIDIRSQSLIQHKQKYEMIQQKIQSNTVLLVTYEKSLQEFDAFIAEYTSNLEKWKVQLEDVTTDLQAFQDNNLEKENQTLFDVTKALQHTKESLEDALHTIAIMQERKAQLTRLEEEKKKDVELQASYVSRIDTLTKTIKDLQEAQKHLEGGIPSYIIAKRIKLIEASINSFMATVKDNLQVQIQYTEKGVTILYKARDEKEFMKLKLASGFEKSLISIAFKYSLALAYKMDYLIIDEVDRSADSTSSVKLFKSIAKIANIKQIFVTTHDLEGLEFLIGQGYSCIQVKDGVYHAL